MYLGNAFLKLGGEKVTNRSETGKVKMVNALFLV